MFHLFDLLTRQRRVCSQRLGSALGIGMVLGSGALHLAHAQPRQIPPVAPPMVAAQSVGASLIFGQVEVGALTAQQAWDSGQLTVDDIVRAANAPRLFSSAKLEDVRLREALVQLLVEHGEKIWMPSTAQEKGTVKTEGEALSDAVRLAIGDVLSKKRDERAVAVYEAMLKELERTRPPLRAVGPLNHLGSFYWDQGKLQEAADVFLRGEKYSSSPEWAAAIRLEAARVYKQMGNAAKAKELYDQIPQFGSGWISALALYDQALPLINAGKLSEAKAILSQPLQAKEQVLNGTIAVNAWLASVSYREGKLEDAMRYGQIALQASEQAKPTGGSIKNLYEMGREVYNRAGVWKTQPIQSDVKELIIKTNPLQPDKPLYARFRIKTYGDTTVTATVDNPAIQVRVLPINNWQREPKEIQQQREVIVQAEQKSIQSLSIMPTISLSTPTHSMKFSVKFVVTDQYSQKN